ncbi:MAG: hypothetical protein ACI4LM_04050 [Anaerovoracaceae bacterium]
MAGKMITKGGEIVSDKNIDNVYTENGERHARTVKKAECLQMNNGELVVNCRIHRLGEHEYFFSPGRHYIYRDRRSRKLLYLDEPAYEAVSAAAKEFTETREDALNNWEKLASEGSGTTIYYTRTGEDAFDLMICFKDKFGNSLEKLASGLRLAEIERSVRFLAFPLPEEKRDALKKLPVDKMICDFYDDELLHLKYRLGKRTATAEECEKLSAMLNKRILPPLPEEYARFYVVDPDTITGSDYVLLSDSGYVFGHLPYFSMKGKTHSKYQINPVSKSMLDAAPEDAEAIPFSEYMKMFDDPR